MARRRGQRAKSEMNVVPYIDVMLVLLVIFMISAPLLNQSVDVDLPNSANAQAIAENQTDDSGNEIQPLVVTIAKGNGNNVEYYIDQIEENTTAVSIPMVSAFTAKMLQENPDTPVYIRADKAVDYGAVMKVMDLLKDSGADAVGLVTADDDSRQDSSQDGGG